MNEQKLINSCELLCSFLELAKTHWHNYHFFQTRGKVMNNSYCETNQKSTTVEKNA